jgi:tRNA modification GTPase
MPCLAIFFPAPRSYTSEDVLELQLPGNPALLEAALHALRDAARLASLPLRVAEPGEFTRRAFLASRLDLTQAEGIAAVISATTDAQLQAGRLLQTGRLGQWASQLVDQIGNALALVEAGVDFTDQDDVVPITPAQLDAQLAVAADELAALRNRSRSAASLEALPWVVLLGPPNSGKSTLFNAMLGHERAVTSPAAGTTRDVLCEPLTITDSRGRPAEIMLVDLAGLDDPVTQLDADMQAAVHDALNRADLIVKLVTVTPLDRHLPDHTPVIRIGAKADVQQHEPHTVDMTVSAVTGAGITDLTRRLAAALGDRAVTLAGEIHALQPRHFAALHAAQQALDLARAGLAEQRGARRSLEDAELIAHHMRAALEALEALGGRLTPDDVLGKVFATFCIGK